MPKTQWRRSLIGIAAELREEAALAESAAGGLEDQPSGPAHAAGQDRAGTLRRRADCYREAAKLLDDAEELIGAAHNARD